MSLYATLMRRALTLLAGGVLAASAAACSSADSPGDASRTGGTAVISAYYELRSMNPLATTGDLNLALERYALFTPLVMYDSALNVTPWLAASWDTARIANDSLALTFHLRNDVSWHDGTRVTAHDVAFTYDLARNPRTAYANAQTFELYSPTYTVIDSTTIRFTLRAHPDFLEAWFLTPPLPAHLLGTEKPETFARSPFGLAPVGSGPFRFVRRSSSGEWVFEANDSFPHALGGRPELDRLVFRAIPEQAAVITALMGGTVDLAVSVRPSNISTLEQAPGVRVLEYPIPNWIFVALNARTRFFDTVEERRAISLAVDRRAIVDGLLGGRNPLGRGTVTPVHVAFDSTLSIPYAPDSARQLLARAGWLDRNGDGVLEDAAGRAFRFRLKAWQSSGAYADIVQALQAQLGSIGVAVDGDIVELNTFSQQMQGSLTEGGGRTRDFDAALGNWTDNLRKDDAQLFHSRWSTGARHWTGYATPRMDAVLDSIAVTLDTATSARLWREYQRLIVEDAPLLVLYYAIGLVGVRERLHGVTADARGPIASVTGWWIDN